MSSAPLFSDRLDAGQQLAQLLLNLVKQFHDGEGVSAQPIVYALPRGGIPVAVPVVRQLNCPLDIVAAKKITNAQNPELAIGAVTSDGHVLWSRFRPIGKRISSSRQTALRQAQTKAQQQLEQLKVACSCVNPRGALALVIDDGIATGMTMAAATRALRKYEPAQIWICSPVAPGGLMKWLEQWGDRVIVLQTPEPFISVSRFYAEFPQVKTNEALVCLQEVNQRFTATNY
ncbi:MAG: phosphoribosyltransferase [Symploca sp. SIO1C4]|uniref:Phosphoribosyltransferase n=1 Tax=Symploca sp. SIO1C4 TaxID=2607765 RepID=A0A6B3N949_9CYAN|nr:phosphoribosyltransferase [Symploca sp. SIO1C4]